MRKEERGKENQNHSFRDVLTPLLLLSSLHPSGISYGHEHRSATISLLMTIYKDFLIANTTRNDGDLQPLTFRNT